MKSFVLWRSCGRSRRSTRPDHAIIGKGETGIHGSLCCVAGWERAKGGGFALLTASHRQGPTYLGILRYTDIPEVIRLLGNKVRLYGEIPLALQQFLGKGGLEKLLSVQSLADAFRY